MSTQTAPAKTNNADNVVYDPSDSSLTSENVQDAIDELDAAIIGSNELSEVLANGNTTGGTDIIVSSGDSLKSASGADLPIVLGDDAGANTIDIKNLSEAVVAFLTSQGGMELLIGLAGVLSLTDGSDVEQEKLNTVGDNFGKGLYLPRAKTTLADDAEVTVSTGKAGFGIVNIGDNQEDAYFTFSTTAVTLRTNSANVANSDSDTNLCIYYSSGNLNIKNRLGSSLDVRYTIWNS
jgi:hypothetical protein